MKIFMKSFTEANKGNKDSLFSSFSFVQK